MKQKSEILSDEGDDKRGSIFSLDSRMRIKVLVQALEQPETEPKDLEAVQLVSSVTWVCLNSR